jgi:hypothetical protein
MKIINVTPTLTLGKSLGCVPVPAPFELSHKIWITQMWIWISVTVQAPPHAEGFDLPYAFHGVDATMALDTTHTTCHVGRMIKIGVVRQIMYTDPLHWTTGGVTLPERLEQLTLWMNLRMAIHACLSWWNSSVRGDLNRVVTVPTVHAELPGVQRMTKRDRLHWLVPNISRLWAEPECNQEGNVQRRRHANNESCRQEQIRPTRKNEVISTHKMHRPHAL